MSEVSCDKKWHWVSLRLMGEGLPVDELESILNLKPSHMGRKGDVYRREARYESNVWVWKLPSASEVPFDEQIENLLTVIESRKEVLREILSSNKVEGELFLGFGSDNGQGGAFFSNELLRRISELGLSIDLDLYPPADFEKSDGDAEDPTGLGLA